MTKTKKIPRHTSSRKSRADWLQAAKQVLIAEGREALSVESVARKLGVTRGGFYWHFSGREDFYEALLETWEQETGSAFEQVVLARYADPFSTFLAMIRLWDAYDPTFDYAIADWARVSPIAAKALERARRLRLVSIQKIFSRMGFSDAEAAIRARIAYLYESGYHAASFRETKRERREQIPLYIEVLTGRKVSLDEVFPGS